MAGWLRWLRWLLVLPVAWLSWIVAAMVALTLYTIAETLCPREQMISGLCTAPWFDHAERAILSLGAGLAAALITVSCTLLAPSHRRVVVVVTLLAGSAIALSMGLKSGHYLALVTAVVAGLAAAWWLRRSGWLAETRAERSVTA
jgi:hypothetical protein